MKITELPDPKTYPVLPPDMNYIYFDGADEFPFQANTVDFSVVNAWWLSEAAFLAYTHPGFARMAFRLAGFDDFRFFGGKTTECFAAWNSGFCIISFRGTELKSVSAFNEVLTDLNAVSAKLSEGGRVHRGFLAALEEVWPGEDGLCAFIDKIIFDKPKRPLWITGHSLGGALAQLAFAKKKKATGLYTFASPRAGDKTFTDLFEGRPSYRVENIGDPITKVPPDMKHVGTPVYLGPDGGVSFTGRKFDPVARGNEAKSTLTRQFGKTIELAKGSVAKFISTGSPLKVAADWGAHFNSSSEEWSSYLNELGELTKFSFDRHAPVYYALKLRNAVAGGKG